MNIRTRKRTKGKPSGDLYNLQGYLAGSGPQGFYDKDGRRVVESLPKLIYLPAISPAGHIVNVTLHSDPNIRDYSNSHAQKNKGFRQDEGFIWAHECPIDSRVLHPDDELALFGEDAKPCRDHDFGWKPGKYAELKLCTHLEMILEARRGEHRKQMSKYRKVRKADSQAEQLRLLTEIAAQGRKATVKTSKATNG